MAGLQYNFFPTDFFFPPQKPAVAGKDIVPQQLSLMKAKKIGDEIDESNQPPNHAIAVKAPPAPSSSLTFKPPQQKRRF